MSSPMPLYVADLLRAFLTDHVGASAHIKANPGSTKKPTIDWSLYTERHQVEGFFHIACAMIWLK
jgi:hypothetical protein